MGTGAIVILSVNPNSKISGTLTLSLVMPQLMLELMEMIRRTNPNGPAYPSLLNLSDYGFIPFYSSYVPYIDIAFEYQVSRGQQQSNGTHHQFSIPLYGDFFSDMVLHMVLEQSQCAPAVFPQNQILADINFPTTNLEQVASQTFTTADGTIINSIDADKGMFHEVLYLYQTVDGMQVPDPTGLYYQDLLKYIDYPGENIQHAEMSINGSKIDGYTKDAYVAYRAFRLTTDKKPAYDRAMGQEQVTDAYTFNLNGDTRQKLSYLDGPQTPKYVQPQLNLWIKLLFWFCMDFKQAIPSAAIPYGQRFMNIQTHDVKKDLLIRVGSIFRVARVNTYQLAQGSAPIVQNGNGTFNLSDVTWMNQGAPISTKEFPTPIQTNGPIQGGTILSSDLHINHLFTVNEVHKIITNRISYYLVRLYRIQHNILAKPQDDIQLTELKYPIEFIMCWAIPQTNQDTENPNHGTDWWKGSFVNRKNFAAEVGTEKQGIQNANISGYAIKEKLQSVLEHISITVQQTPLYEKKLQSFYSDYLPLQWPDTTSNVDPGKAIIPFKLYDLYNIQPAGSVNASRIRDFYLNYVAPKLNSYTNAQLVIVAIALNFLLISDGTATIRYLA